MDSKPSRVAVGCNQPFMRLSQDSKEKFLKKIGAMQQGPNFIERYFTFLTLLNIEGLFSIGG